MKNLILILALLSSILLFNACASSGIKERVEQNIKEFNERFDSASKEIKNEKG